MATTTNDASRRLLVHTANTKCQPQRSRPRPACPRPMGRGRSHGRQQAERCAAPQAAPKGNAQGKCTAESSPGRRAPQRPERLAEARGQRNATASEEGAPTTPTEAWGSTTSTAQQRSAKPKAAERATEHKTCVSESAGTTAVRAGRVATPPVHLVTFCLFPGFVYIKGH